MERVKKDIFQSQIFDNLKKQHQDFMAFIDRKIVAVEGDIVSLFYIKRELCGLMTD
jgi:hypothetical protein